MDWAAALIQDSANINKNGKMMPAMKKDGISSPGIDLYVCEDAKVYIWLLETVTNAMP